MKILSKKIVYACLLAAGVITVLSPFWLAAVFGDGTIVDNNYVAIPLMILGLLILVIANVFAAKAFRCASCMNPYIVHQGGRSGTVAVGLSGILRILRLKRCPHCNEELK